MDFRDIIRLRTANMGYWLGEEHWGKGVMSKVVPAFARWCIDTWGRLVRIDGGGELVFSQAGALLKLSLTDSASSVCGKSCQL